MRSHKQAGLSLIELVVFIVISSFFVLVSFSLLKLMPAQVNKPLLNSLLIDIAQEELQRYVIAPFDDIALGKFEKIYPEQNINIAIRVEYQADSLLRNPKASKRITVTAKHVDANVNLSVYRFDD